MICLVDQSTNFLVFLQQNTKHSKLVNANSKAIVINFDAIGNGRNKRSRNHDYRVDHSECFAAKKANVQAFLIVSMLGGGGDSFTSFPSLAALFHLRSSRPFHIQHLIIFTFLSQFLLMTISLFYTNAQRRQNPKIDIPNASLFAAQPAEIGKRKFRRTSSRRLKISEKIRDEEVSNHRPPNLRYIRAKSNLHCHTSC